MPSTDVRSHPSPAAATLLGLIFASLSGCMSAGAPDVELEGAYFPAWLLCAVVGIVGAALARVIFVVTHVAEQVPYQLAVCTAIGLIVAVGTWLLFFR